MSFSVAHARAKDLSWARACKRSAPHARMRFKRLRIINLQDTLVSLAHKVTRAIGALLRAVGRIYIGTYMCAVPSEEERWLTYARFFHFVRWICIVARDTLRCAHFAGVSSAEAGEKITNGGAGRYENTRKFFPDFNFGWRDAVVVV